MIHSQGHQISSVRLSRRVSIPLLLLLGLSATGLLFTPLWVGLGTIRHPYSGRVLVRRPSR